MKRRLLYAFVFLFVVATVVTLLCINRGYLGNLAVACLVASASTAVTISRRTDLVGASALTRKKVEPIKLSHSISGAPPLGPNCFRWEGGRLVHSYARNRREFTPTTAQWEEFWRVCDEIDIWSWPPTIGQVRTIDGLGWVTELAVGSRRMKTWGHAHGTPPDIGAKFIRFHRALQALAGWHPTSEEEKNWRWPATY